jgi:hypothetical protein
MALTAILYASIPVAVFATDRTVDVLPNELYEGPVTAETILGEGSLNGLKLSSAANESSYEW